MPAVMRFMCVRVCVRVGNKKETKARPTTAPELLADTYQFTERRVLVCVHLPR